MLLSLLFLASSVFAQAPGSTPLAMAPHSADAGGATLESAEGGGSVQLLRAGQWQPLTSGTRVQIGDHVKTDPQTAARLLYDDGSTVSLSEDTETVVGQSASKKAALQILRGGVHAQIVHPADDPATLDPDGKPPYRFFIITPTAVAGVRGTEFVLENAAQSSELHTLDGTVDVGHDYNAMKSGSVTPVSTAQSVQAGAQGVSKPQAFNVAQFNKQFAARHPALSRLRQRPVVRPRAAARQQARAAAKPAVAAPAAQAKADRAAARQQAREQAREQRAEQRADRRAKRKKKN